MTGAGNLSLDLLESPVAQSESWNNADRIDLCGGLDVRFHSDRHEIPASLRIGQLASELLGGDAMTADSSPRVKRKSSRVV